MGEDGLHGERILDGTISRHLDAAEVILLLVSAPSPRAPGGGAWGSGRVTFRRLPAP